MSFAHLMAGQVGRSVRVVAGLALIIAGLVLDALDGGSVTSNSTESMMPNSPSREFENKSSR